MFVLFEGVEGGGKTTQARRLYRHLRRHGVPVILVREPGGTAVGNAARKILKHKLDIEIDPITELLLFAASRAQLVSEVIRPALQEGQVVICDRYAESTLAYQGYGRGLDLETIRTINRIATGGLHPHLIVLLDLDPEHGLRRKGSHTANDRFEREEIEFHRRVRRGYLEMAGAEPGRWMVIDASRPPTTVAKLIRQRVEASLPPAIQGSPGQGSENIDH